MMAYMSAAFSRSICTHCLPVPNSTQDPSSPSLSPSVIRLSVPMAGLLSLAVTFLPLARFTVPMGTKKSGRLPVRLGSRFGTVKLKFGIGVPSNSGLGKSVFSGILSSASAPLAKENNAAQTASLKTFFPIPRRYQELGGGFAKHFDFDVVVHFVGRVALAVKADITAFRAFRVNQFAFVGFDVGEVFAGADGVVENRGHILFKLRVVGNLHDHVGINAGLGMEMPDDHGGNFRFLFQVNLHPLLAGAEFNPGAFVAFLVAIGDEVERADDGLVVAGGNFFALGQIARAGGDEKIRPLAFLLLRLKVGNPFDGH